MKIKKILSIVLVMAMMLSLAAVGTISSSAATPTIHSATPAMDATKTTAVVDNQTVTLVDGVIPSSYLDGKTTVTIDGVKYNVVQTWSDFYDVDTKSLTGNYILNTDLTYYSDIGVDVTNPYTHLNNALVDGNGHCLTNIYSSSESVALIEVLGNVTIRNLQIGTPEAPAKMAGGLFSVYEDGVNENSTNASTGVVTYHREGDILLVTFENVHLYVENGSENSNFAGGFFAMGSNYKKSTTTTSGTGSYIFRNCSVHGSVTSKSATQTTSFTNGVTSVEGVPAAGGFIGFIVGNYGEIGLYNCVNYATVKGGVAAGGFVGRCGTIIASNSTNMGDVSGTPIVNSTHSGVGGFAGYSGGDADLKDCVNTGTITGNSPIGGFIGWKNDSYLLMENCTNTGVINCTGEGMVYNGTSKYDGAGGLVGELDTDDREAGYINRIENCYNYADIYTKARKNGGIVGTTKWGARLELLDCVNYGSINVDTGVKESIIGGIVGVAAGNLVNLERCINYGALTSTGNMGGLLGEAGTTINVKDSINIGSLTRVGGTFTIPYFNGSTISIPDDDSVTGEGDGSLGGLFGYTSGKFTLTNCANIGTITISESCYPGRLGGLVAGGGKSASGSTITDCYSFGKVVGTPSGNFYYGTMVGLATWYSTSTDEAKHTVTNSYYGATPSGATLVNTTNCKGSSTLNDAARVTKLNTAFEDVLGISFLNDSAITLATPVIRATQETTPVDGVQDVRFIGTIDTLKYQRIGFNVTTIVDGVVTERGDIKCHYVYHSILADGQTYTAADFNGKYIYALTVTDVPVAEHVTFILTPYAETSAGVRYTGAATTVYYEGGACVSEESEIDTASMTNEITVLTYNVWTNNSNCPTRLNDIADWAKSVGADIFGGQEMRKDNGNDSYDVILNRLGSSYSGVFAEASGANYDQSGYGNGLYWNTNVFTKVSSTKVAVSHDHTSNSSCDVHETRVLQIVRLKHKATDEYFTVFNTHFGLTDEDKNAMVDALETELAKVADGDKVLFMGDLNHNAQNSYYGRIRLETELLSSRRVVSGSDLRFGGTTVSGIDFIYSSRDLYAVNYFENAKTLLKSDGVYVSGTYSDHPGVVAVFKW